MVHQTWLRRIRVGDPTELSLVGHSFRPHDNFLVHVRTLTCVARALVVNTPSFEVPELLSLSIQRRRGLDRCVDRQLS